MPGCCAEDARSPGVRAVREALRLYQAAEAAMRRRTGESMSMGENGLLVVRQLLRARTRGEHVKPVDITRYLGVSSASTTAILDRLEHGGYISRVPHPTDRRSVYIEATDRAEDDVRATLTTMHDRMHEVAASLTPEDSAAVVDFFARMQDAVDQVGVDAAR